MQVGRFHNAQDGSSCDILQWEVDKVCFRVDRHGVGVGHEESTCWSKGFAVLAENSDITGFGGDIEELQARIEGEDVGIFADRIRGENLHRGEVEDADAVIIFAGDEGEAGGDVERDAVRAFYAGHGMARDDFGGGRVDDCNLIGLVNRDQDVAGIWVIHSIACATAEGDGGDERVGGCVDYGVSIAMLIGDEDALGARSVGDTVGISDRASFGEGPQGIHLDDGEFVFAGGGSENAIDFRYGPDTMDVGEAREISDHLALNCVEHHKVVRVHVRDIEAMVGDIKALVVKADGGVGEGYVGHLGEWGMNLSGGGQGYEESDGENSSGMHAEKV